VALAAAALAAKAGAYTTTADIVINVGTPVQTVDNRVFGLNTAVWNTYNTTFGYGQVIGLLQQANTQVFRYPGGSTADTFHWQDTTLTNPLLDSHGLPTTVPDTNPAHNQDDSGFGTTFDDFALMANTLGAQAFITLNYGSGSVSEGAAWLTYSNITKHYGFKYWEVGNECYGAWEMDGNKNTSNGYTHDAVAYADLFAQYYTALKAIDPTIKLGAVVDSPIQDGVEQREVVNNPTTGQSHGGWGPVMFVEMLKKGVVPDFVIYHRYEQNPGSESDSGVLQAASSPNGDPWSRDAANMRVMLNQYFGPTVGPTIEMDCTENNSVNTNPGKQSVSLVNGLYMADSVGSILQTEFKSLVWWDTFNGQIDSGSNDSSTLYGWRQFGDYGIMDAGVTGGPYPTYYVHKLLSHFARGGDTIVQATVSNDYDNFDFLVAAYAAKRLDGSLSIMVINKDPSNAWTGNFTINGFPSLPSTATVYSYGIPQDNAAQTAPDTAAADIQTTTMTGISPAFSATFPAYSVSILTMAPPPPTISVGPVGQTMNSGSTLVLTAQGSNATSYQWFLNGTLISDSALGATSNIISDSAGPQLIISKITSLSNGSYTVKAVNSTGTSAASSAAAVSVVTATNPGTVGSISARAFVGTNDNILIGGFFIAGTTSRSVLIQAIGPGLIPPPYNVASPLAKPALSVHQSQNGADVVLYSNTGWGSNPVLLTSASKLSALPVLQPGSADSELLLTLPPGGYTAEVASADNVSTGVALCAIYQLP
jgi:hypothetical protein